ncbi:MAG: hypothetical protein KFF73_02330 [Cyclobacteriaceae bacterium]|nr:hypothetical protein [Cyclobacteriaceae bacterium]
MDNGFALNGLYHSLENQGREDEAGKIRNRFEKASKYADTELKYSRIDPDKRVDLVLRAGDESPSDLKYIVSTLCGFN